MQPTSGSFQQGPFVDLDMEIVPPHAEACDVCAGKKDRPRPKAGERWSARETVRRICRACYAEFLQDIGVQRNVGPLRRKVQLPNEPDQI
jgi:hypothetical protein